VTGAVEAGVTVVAAVEAAGVTAVTAVTAFIFSPGRTCSVIDFVVYVVRDEYIFNFLYLLYKQYKHYLLTICSRVIQ
jgi:hypothetical protein